MREGGARFLAASPDRDDVAATIGSIGHDTRAPPEWIALVAPALQSAW